MKMPRPSLLSPTNHDITKAVETNEKEWGFGDKLLYTKCLKAMKGVDLSRIKEEDVRGPIRVFLINWGMMARVLGRENKKGWEERLLHTLPSICSELERFRRLKLEEQDYLSGLKDDIRRCYGEFKKIVGATSASKILHLICPRFFPMWDEAVREEASKERRGRGNRGFADGPAGYYKFMIEIQAFLITYDASLNALARRYAKPKLRIVDEYMWTRVHPPDCG